MSKREASVKAARFAERIRAAARRRRALSSSRRTNAYRVFHGEADGVAGVTVDWFDGVAVCSLYDAWDAYSEEAWLAALVDELEPQTLYLKRRPRQASRLAPGEVASLAPEAPVFGPAVAGHVILENDLRFLIRPADGLAVGLYLDMRDARQWLRQQAESKTVLNCFAYTCAFAVYARSGGARRVINVDLSRRALEWGAENSALNQQSVAPDDHICADAFDWVRRLRKRGEQFDLVIADPPSFATSKRDKFAASKDWPRLAEACCEVLRGGGQLAASCNQASVSRQRFEQMLERGFDAAGRRARLLQRLGAPSVDFPTSRGAAAALKVSVYQLD